MVTLRPFVVSAFVLGIAGCSPQPSAQAGTLFQIPDQGVRERIQLPGRLIAEVETAPTETLRQWLLPEEVLVSRHRLYHAPGTWTTIVAFDGAGTEIAPGVCRYDQWLVSISADGDPRHVTPFLRQRIPQYIDAPANDCSQPAGGISASSDAEGIDGVRALMIPLNTVARRD